MKKSVKIIVTSCVVALGVGASIGGAYALYTSQATPTTFDIGTYTHSSSGTITYKAGDPVSTLGAGEKINPDHPTVTVKVPLGGLYSNDIPNQEVVYGNLSVKATISSGLVNKVRWAVYMQGYKDGSYWANTNSINTFTTQVESQDPYLAALETTVAGDVGVKAVENPGIAVDANSDGIYDNQWVEIFLNFNDITADDGFVNFAGETVRLDVTFDKHSNEASVPHVTGDELAWTDEDEYEMVPQIDEEFFQWYYKGLTGMTGMGIHNGDNTWAKAHPDIGNDNRKDDGYSGYNVLLDSAKTYSVYSTGMQGNVLKINTDTNIVYQDPQHE